MKMFDTNAICRLCLKVDVKVYKLGNTHQAFVENIFKLKQFNYVPSDDYYVCYICKALLLKTINFIQTICNAQEIICGLLKNTDLITKPLLECIDRHKKNLNPITLSSCAFICGKEIIFDSFEVHNETEVKDPLSISEERQNQDEKLNKEYDTNINNIDSPGFSESSCVIVNSSSDETNTEPNKYDEVQVKTQDTLAVDDVKQNGDPKHKYTKCFDTCDDPKAMAQKKKISHHLKRFKKKRSVSFSSESSSEEKNKEKRKRSEKDEDYQPDSTSHSEDSDYDSYDDSGKRIKRPKQNELEYPRQCDHCDYEVLIKKDHYRHYQFAHPNIEYPYGIEKTYACLICGKLMTKQRILTHERSHTAQKIKCKLCSKVFSSLNRKNNHMFNVHPKKTYTCDYCSKIFKTRTDIMRHLRIHTGTKPFKCHICGAAFAHSGNRGIHIRSAHQNVKYVPKSRTKKVRRKNKQNSPDIEIKSKDKKGMKGERKNAKKSRKRKYYSDSENSSENDIVQHKKKRTHTKQNTESKKVNPSDTTMVSKEGKINRTRKKVGCTDIDKQNENRGKNTLNNNNTDSESDDETLAVIKGKKKNSKRT